MELNLQIIYVAISVLVLILLITITRRITKRVTAVKKLEPNRRKSVLNVFYFLYYIIFFSAVIIILGIKWDQISVFLSSILAVIGIAFFAQWSILSNLTASIVLFFYHPIKIGDRIRILDKELEFQGYVKDITGFYVLIESKDKRKFSIPNSLVLQKGIEFIKDDD